VKLVSVQIMREGKPAKRVSAVFSCSAGIEVVVPISESESFSDKL